MLEEREMPGPQTDAEWLREFAETYRNGTIKSVEEEYRRLRLIADRLTTDGNISHHLKD